LLIYRIEDELPDLFIYNKGLAGNEFLPSFGQDSSIALIMGSPPFWIGGMIVDKRSPRDGYRYKKQTIPFMAYISAKNESPQPTFLAVISVLLFLSTVSIEMRLYCPLILVHQRRLDDYLIVTGLFVTIVMGILNRFHISLGTG